MVYEESSYDVIHDKKLDLLQNVRQKMPIISDGKSFFSI